MGLVDEIRLQGVVTRISEEMLYAEVLREIENGIRRDGLWAKALSQSNMQQDAAKETLHNPVRRMLGVSCP